MNQHTCLSFMKTLHIARNKNRKHKDCRPNHAQNYTINNGIILPRNKFILLDFTIEIKETSLAPTNHIQDVIHILAFAITTLPLVAKGVVPGLVHVS